MPLRVGLRRPRLSALGVSRGELFAALSIVGFANGVAFDATRSVVRYGGWNALTSTFDISALVWIAFYVCPTLMAREPREALSRPDVAVASVAVVAFMLPVPWLSWFTLTGLASYLLYYSHVVRSQGYPGTLDRGAWVLLAVTGAMFWGRLLLLLAGDHIVRADAVLVSWLTGTQRLDNILQSADGSGYVWIAPGCSSLTNVSLAVLCWVLFAQYHGLRGSRLNMGWCLLACLSVLSINAVRISLIVLHGEYYDVLHGRLGVGVAGWLTVLTTVAICYYGVRRGRLAQA